MLGKFQVGFGWIIDVMGLMPHRIKLLKNKVMTPLKDRDVA
jgi:hypothetical protein